MNLPVLGVGLSYSAGVASLAEQEPDLVDFIEIEPQTLWYQTPAELPPYRVDREVVERLLALPCPKLLHGVGNPVGGSRPPLAESTILVAEMAAELGVPWVSEHLSFNRFGDLPGGSMTGFLLPPRQTREGISAAIASIKVMTERMPVPLAVETGVNYLRPRSDELQDGQFVAGVVEGADCGLLLDLHNLWANERNGRQPVAEFLDQIPLERVWEVHLAGGTERDGYWLDAHSGAVPPSLFELARTVLPRLPNLRALVFELFPAFLSSFGLAGYAMNWVASAGCGWDGIARPPRLGDPTWHGGRSYPSRANRPRLVNGRTRLVAWWWAEMYQGRSLSNSERILG